MNKRDLKKFENLLLAEREKHVTGVRSLREGTFYESMLSNEIADPEDPASVGTEANQRDTAIKLAGAESEIVYEIDEALRRIREGTYGVCEGTGEPIPKARLEAFPTARYCVEYQAELEKQQKQGY